MPSRRHIAQQNRLLVQPRDHDIDPAITVEIAESRAAMERLSGQRQGAKLASPLVDIDEIWLPRFATRRQLCVIHYVTTGDENIRSEEHTSELQSRLHLVCRLLLEKKKNHC